MRLKFIDTTQIHAQFENPAQMKSRAQQISKIASNVIRKLEEPKLFRRLKERVLDIWKV